MKIIGMIISILLLYSCSLNQEEQEKHGEDHENHLPEGMVFLTDKQIEVLELKTAPLDQRSINTSIKVNGRLELAPQDKATITSMLSGVITNIKVIEGDQVKKGEIIATIQTLDFLKIQEEYSSEMARFERLKKELERASNLYQKNIISDAELQKVKSEYKQSQSSLQAKKMKLKMLRVSPESISKGNYSSSYFIRAPFSGDISAVHVNTGTFIHPEDELFEMINNDELHVDFMVYEKDFYSLKKNQNIRFRTNVYPDKEFYGKIHAISPLFEEEQNAVHVHAEIINKDHLLIPGMFVEGEILRGEKKVKAIPTESVVNVGDKYYVFIEAKRKRQKQKGRTFLMVEVVKGETDGYFTEIRFLNQLPKDIKVVTNGAYYLLSEMKKSEAEHSH